jgi:hypothetical protein
VAQLRLHLTHSGPRPMRSPECAHVA